jgi:hypothetical protein
MAGTGLSPQRPHEGLDGITPLARYQQDLSKIRPLGLLAAKLDALFHHRVSRRVRKDGTVSYQGKRFEVPFELSGKTVCLVVDPHTEIVVASRTSTASRSAWPRRSMRWPISIASDANPGRWTPARSRGPART